MYLTFYGLRREPFHITPDPALLYLSPSHREALASMVYALQNRKGFISLIGEVGTGKSTLVRALLKRLNHKLVKTVYCFNANITFPELLHTIFQELGLTCDCTEPFEMVQALHAELIRFYTAGQIVLLVIDEAQNMPVDTLENLRMLSNLETTQDKLLQIMLIGQPELEEKLNRYELRQLNQRLAMRAMIQPLTQRESIAYLRHRLAQSGAIPGQVLSQSAIRQIARSAKGIPRVINILADNILVTGFGYQARPVSAGIAASVIRQYFKKTRSHTWQWGFAAAAACMIMTGLYLGWPYLSQARGLWQRVTQSRAPVSDVKNSTPAGTAGQPSQDYALSALDREAYELLANQQKEQ